MTKHFVTSAKQTRPSPAEDAPLVFRKPTARDGYGVHRLISQCPPLDSNSVYCNLLQCTHFADSCILAEHDGKAAAFISSYVPPQEKDTLFVWQVAVRNDMRGRGLAKKMLHRLLALPVCNDIRKLQTTITRDNKASWHLFRSFARDLEADCHDEVMFSRKKHFSDRHASEHLLTISPLKK